jgi:HEAT repeat protein
LMQAVKGKDSAVHEAAITALGEIHDEPDVVIPFLISYLDDDDLNDEAATALGNFGSLAKPAIPKILPLLHAADDDAQAAAKAALLKIDPDAAAKVGVKTDSPESGK